MIRATELSRERRLAQADLLFLLAGLLSPPPADRSRFEIDGGTTRALLDAAGLPSGDRARGALRRALDAAARMEAASWREEYTRLFDGAGVSPLNETVYVRRDKGAILADLAGFYHAFRWRPAARGEKHDTLPVELEFAALLLVSVAQAEAAEQADVAHEALRSFAGDHLGEWIDLFAMRLERTTELSLYRDVAEAVSGVWRGIVRANGLPLSPEAGPCPELAEDGASFTCGLEDRAGTEE